MSVNLKTSGLALRELIENRRGGGFWVHPGRSVSNLEMLTGVLRYDDLKPFTVSIYNQASETEKVSLTFLINPTEMSRSNSFVSSDVLLREGWLGILWGKNQTKLSATVSTAAFYVSGRGVTNVNRRFSLAFQNFAAFIGIFKNGGYYYYQGLGESDLFQSSPGRVISVMDIIKISYDGDEYLGSFDNLSVDESTDKPFRLDLSFEFTVSASKGEQIEGHNYICDESGCNNTPHVPIQIQGAYTYDQIVKVDEDEMKEAFYSTVDYETVSRAALKSMPVDEGDEKNVAQGGVTLSESEKKNASEFVEAIGAFTEDSKFKESINYGYKRITKLFDNGIPSTKNPAKTFDQMEKEVDDFIAKNKPGYAKVSGYFDRTTSICILSNESSGLTAAQWENKNGSKLENVNKNGTYDSGIAQININTYRDLLKDSQFVNFMASKGYSEAELKNVPTTAGAKANILRDDDQFNMYTHLYLGKTSYVSPLKSAVQANGDNRSATGVIAASYNGGPGVFVNKNRKTVSAQVKTYAQRAVAKYDYVSAWEEERKRK